MVELVNCLYRSNVWLAAVKQSESLESLPFTNLNQGLLLLRFCWEEGEGADKAVVEEPTKGFEHYSHLFRKRKLSFFCIRDGLIEGIGVEGRVSARLKEYYV